MVIAALWDRQLNARVLTFEDSNTHGRWIRFDKELESIEIIIMSQSLDVILNVIGIA
jgi:hypothetical protein